MQDALRAALVADEHVGVIIKQTAGDVGAEVGGDLLDLEAGDVLHEVLGVRADVAHAVRDAGAVRIHAPVGDLLDLAGLQGADGVTLRVFDEDLVDLAELAGGHEVTGFLDHRVAGVVMQQREDQAALLHDGAELLAFGQGEREGLLADHVDAGFEEGLGHGVVQVVARDDRHEVDAVAERALGFGLGHLGVRSVHAGGVEAEVLAGEAGLLGIRGERAGDEVDLAVEGRGHAVDAADEGAATAADHAHAEFAIKGCHRCVDQRETGLPDFAEA